MSVWGLDDLAEELLRATSLIPAFLVLEETPARAQCSLDE